MGNQRTIRAPPAKRAGSTFRLPVRGILTVLMLAVILRAVHFDAWCPPEFNFTTTSGKMAVSFRPSAKEMIAKMPTMALAAAYTLLGLFALNVLLAALGERNKGGVLRSQATLEERNKAAEEQTVKAIEFANLSKLLTEQAAENIEQRGMI